MADAVDVQVLANTRTKYVVRILSASDGTGESAVIKVDKSTLTGPITGVEPGRLALERAHGNVQGMQVKLLWDHDTDDEMVILDGGQVDRDYREYGGLVDPASTGGTGDVLLTTTGHTAGDSYDLTLEFRKKA